MSSREAERNFNMALKVLNLGVAGADSMVNTVNQILNYLGRDKSASLLKDYIKSGGECVCSFSQPQYMEEISRRLKESGIIHVCAKNYAMNGVGMFILRDKDAKEAEKIFDKFRAEYSRGGCVDRSILYHAANGNVRSIENLDMFEGLLFVEHAREKGLNVSLAEPEIGKYKLMFAGDDAKAISAIKKQVAVELSGYAGEALQKQLAYENSNMLRISDRAVQTTDEFDIVDLNGNHAHSAHYGVLCSGPNGTFHFSRSDKSFERDVKSYLSNFNDPTDLTTEEYKEFLAMDPAATKEFLLQTDIDHGRPQYSRAEQEAVKEMREKLSLYEQKLAMDNPDQEVYGYSYTNDEMRIGTFEDFEQINADAVHDKNEAFATLDPVFYDEARTRYRGYEDHQEKVTFEMEELANTILERDETELNKAFEQENRDYDYMSDRNANMIPDEFEEHL